MSSPAEASSAASAAKDGKGKDRLEKVLHRVRSVFRKGESSRRKSAPPPSGATSEPKVPTAAAIESEPVPPATKEQPEYPGATKIPRSQIHEERAKKLGARFGLEIKPSEWHSAEGDVLRVEKRCGDCPRDPDERTKYPYGYPNDEPGEKFKGVYSCHECGTKFPPNVDNGADCPDCSHRKCSDCRRVRPRKVEPEFSPEVLESLRLRWEELKLGES
ncbi:hypothetical protein DL770_003003 [Monosporascus sp. CRB-9-2]|nr:hypothetical protein DL770_003003 [Monosporascus sp. CRB-9-2]